MSKYVQLIVQVHSKYQKDFMGSIPRLASHPSQTESDLARA